ncbi:MAG: thioesterase family protein [Anaerolineales bacterium]|jgi:acyl-CoA thioester hydrolase
MNTFRYYQLIQVRYADTDAQGHVFFGNYLTYFDEALGGYFQAIGFDWKALSNMGLDMVYIDAQCQYKGSATYAEMLRVYARIAKIGNTSFSVEFKINLENSDKKITTGSITAVVIDSKTRKPHRVPNEIREAVAAYEGSIPA